MLKDDCIFCNIIKGIVPSLKIHENDKYLAILDIAQFTEGHTIVIPKDHIEFVWDAPQIGEYFEFVKKIGDHYRELGYSYVDVLTFGRLVHHAHVHLVPHKGDDPDWKQALSVIGEYQVDPSRRPGADKGEKIAEKFRMNPNLSE
ncbi:MAG: HIT domain-containing protein [Candidatus Dojkabacteria bacterium]|nr:HIT domain-containing protein [Candidatus Dojkabacteria bacterium]